MRAPKRPFLFQYYKKAKYDYTAFMHEVHVVRRGKAPDSLKFDRYDMKMSLLPKKYGWGIHFDEDGKMALVDSSSARYQKLSGSVKTEKALNNESA